MSTKALEKRVTTWLRVRVIYRISVQLHQLVRIGLLLAVTAHGKRVLTHLQQAHKKQEINTFIETKNPTVINADIG